MAFHDLTPNGTAPPNAQILLGLGSKFICTPPTTTGALDRTFKRFERDFYIKVIYSGEEEDPSDEYLPIDRGRSKLYVNSKWCPTAGDVPYWCSQRLSKFFVRVQKLFRRRPATSNLFPHQLELLDSLSEHPDFLFPETDKGLGPCCVTYDQYVQDALIHLKTEEVYQQLSETEASNIIATLDDSISTWLARYKSKIGRMAVQFIDNHRTENSASPFGQFYILYKRHKKQRKDGTWPTRPVCSDVTSLPHALGKWVTEQLVPIQRNMPSYFKDSFALKHLLDELSLPPNALLFTSDATSMYTNIKTTPALECISDFLRAVQQDYNHLHCEALIEALHIVFRNNLFKFGDTFWRQISGTAMGTPPAPAWATIFFAIYEMKLVPRWQTHLLFYKRFIDDVFGVWLTHPDPIVNKRLWTDFCTAMNGWHGLEWETVEPSTSVNFMDMTITIVDGKLETTLYEKEQNLYLYIPPHSSHPKGVFSGLIFGQVLRIRRLCTKRADANMNISQFFDRLVVRGHNPTTLLPLFRKAEENASAYLSRSPSEHELVRKQNGSTLGTKYIFTYSSILRTLLPLKSLLFGEI